MYFQVKSINKFVILFLIVLFIGIFLPLLNFKYNTFYIILVAFFLSIFLLVFLPIEIWKIILLILFVGPLLPYSYHLNKFTEPHFGGVLPYFVITPTYLAFFLSVLLLIIFYKKKLSVDSKLEKSLFIWILFAVYSYIISIVNATNLNASFFEFIRMVIAVGIGIIVYLLINSKEKLKSILIIIGFVLLMESAIAFLQELAILPRDLLLGEVIGTSDTIYFTQIFRRPAGTLREPNTLAKFLSLYIPIFFILSIILKKSKEKIFSLIVLFFSLISLFMTLGRSAIVATILSSFSSLFILGLFAKEYLPSKKFIISGVSVILVFILIIGGFLFQVLYLRFIALGFLAVGGRVEQYQNAVYIIKNNFLFGIGLNNYCYKMIMQDITGIAAATPQFVVHNLYLLYFAETGIFGIMLFVSFFLYLFKKGFKTLKLGVFEPYSLAILTGGMGGIISILLQSILGWGVRSVTLFSLFFVIGLIIGSENMIQRYLKKDTNL